MPSLMNRFACSLAIGSSAYPGAQLCFNCPFPNSYSKYFIISDMFLGRTFVLGTYLILPRDAGWTRKFLAYQMSLLFQRFVGPRAQPF